MAGEASLVEALSVFPDSVSVSKAESTLDVAARVVQADVLLVDLGVQPSMMLEQIRSLTLDTPVLALVPTADFLAAIGAGASGALHRDSPPETIVAALRAIDEGLAVFDRSFVARLVPAETQVSETAEHDSLTPRENQVLALLAEGLSNKEIASRLDISDHTAKFHVNSILQKMGAQKRVEAVVRAARLGIIDL